MDDRSIDLTPLDPTLDRESWERRIAVIMAQAAPELARRAAAGSHGGRRGPHHGLEAEVFEDLKLDAGCSPPSSSGSTTARWPSAGGASRAVLNPEATREGREWWKEDLP